MREMTVYRGVKKISKDERCSGLQKMAIDVFNFFKIIVVREVTKRKGISQAGSVRYYIFSDLFPLFCCYHNISEVVPS